MNCRIPMERFTQIVAETPTTMTTTPLLTIPNRNGCALIALGSADTVGVVRLKPRNASFPTGIPIYVSARSPFIGYIDGPIDVFSVVSGNTSFSATLDLIVYEGIPPLVPLRAVQNYSAPLTLDGSGAGSSGNVKVTGRKRIRISASSQIAATFTGLYTALGYFGGGTVATGLMQPVTLDSATTAAAAASFAEFSTPGRHVVTVVPGVSVIDYVNITISSGTAGDDMTVGVQAWDD